MRRTQKTWLAVVVALGCTPDEEAPNVPSEEELLESAESICLLEQRCFEVHETAEELSACTGIIRSQVAVDVYECDWLWIDLNECLTSSTCENYDLYDRYKHGTCIDEYQEWQNCRRELNKQ